MVFTSPVFIFHFLALFFVVYGFGVVIRKIATALLAKDAPASPGDAATPTPSFAKTYLSSFWLCNFIIFIFSLMFYYWGEGDKIFILLGVILVNFFMARKLEPGTPGSTPGSRKRLLVICLLVNLACLFFFKYCSFTVSLAVDVFGLKITPPKIALPLGISFYTFQAMSYVIDVYRGTVAANQSLTSFGCYIAMFPQLVAGPIVRYTTIAQQLTSRFVSMDKFAYGAERFIFGLAKKVLVANQVAIFVDVCFGMQAGRVTTVTAWVSALAYAIQTYFDFSGYSDMAIGLGKMLGFDFKENFLHPFSSTSMQGFWHRWHLSLSTWFRDYLYFPLGGSRKGTVRTYFNLWMVFFLCGLWHGAVLNLILWGLFHGFFLVFERVTKINFARFPLLGHIYMWVVVLVGVVIFRAENFSQMWEYYYAMSSWIPSRVECEYVWLWFTPDVKMALIVGIILSYPVYPYVQAAAEKRIAGLSGMRRWVMGTGMQVFRLLLLITLFVLCVPLILGDSYNPFIYFRF